MAEVRDVIILITQETQKGHKAGGRDLEATRDTHTRGQHTPVSATVVVNWTLPENDQ